MPLFVPAVSPPEVPTPPAPTPSLTRLPSPSSLEPSPPAERMRMPSESLTTIVSAVEVNRVSYVRRVSARLSPEACAQRNTVFFCDGTKEGQHVNKKRGEHVHGHYGLFWDPDSPGKSNDECGLIDRPFLCQRALQVAAPDIVLFVVVRLQKIPRPNKPRKLHSNPIAVSGSGHTRK